MGVVVGVTTFAICVCLGLAALGTTYAVYRRRKTRQKKYAHGLHIDLSCNAYIIMYMIHVYMHMY